jgi:hypothetical protein
MIFGPCLDRDWIPVEGNPLHFIDAERRSAFLSRDPDRVCVPPALLAATAMSVTNLQTISFITPQAGGVRLAPGR